MAEEKAAAPGGNNAGQTYAHSEHYEEDLLGRAPYASAIAEFLLAKGTKFPLTISVEAEWGAGKSAFLSEIKKKLHEISHKSQQPPFTTVDFNPWRHDDGEALWAVFAQEFLRQVAKGLGWWQRLRARGRVIWYRTKKRGLAGEFARWFLFYAPAGALLLVAVLLAVEHRNSIRSVVGSGWLAAISAGVPLFAALGALFLRARSAFLDASGPGLRQFFRSPDFAARSAFIDEFYRDFANVVRAYAKDGRKIIVFVDDLDRCAVPVAADLLEAINRMLPGSDDLPVGFVLAMDREKVAAGHAAKHKDLMPFLYGKDYSNEDAKRYGHQFIEKFIQLPFSLPRPSIKNVRRYVHALNMERTEKGVGTEDSVLPRPQTDLDSETGVREPMGHDVGVESPATSAARQSHDSGVSETSESSFTKLEVAFGSTEIQRVQVDLARFIGSNARRIKQMVNLMRFRFLVGSKTEMIPVAQKDDIDGSILLIGKLVVLQLSFPLHFYRLKKDHRWWDQWLNLNGDQQLRQLLQLGGSDAPNPSVLRRLLEVAPVALVSSEAGIDVAPDSSSTVSYEIEWIQIPGGTFQMGSESGYENEKPVHDVTVSSFEISATPITNSQYQRFVESENYSPPEYWEDGAVPAGLENHPVVNVSYDDAVEFCKWLGRERNSTVRLPREAEWEYAARGPEGRVYPWGNDEPDESRANFGMNVGSTTDVRAYDKGKTTEGLWDMSGNVWEWCSDWYRAYTKEPRRNPTGPEQGDGRVVRGGSWLGIPYYLRASFRYDNYHPDYRRGHLGFRVVRA